MFLFFQEIFVPFMIESVKETTLGANQLLKENKRFQWKSEDIPMEKDNLQKRQFLDILEDKDTFHGYNKTVLQEHAGSAPQQQSKPNETNLNINPYVSGDNATNLMNPNGSQQNEMNPYGAKYNETNPSVNLNMNTNINPNGSQQQQANPNINDAKYKEINPAINSSESQVNYNNTNKSHRKKRVAYVKSIIKRNATNVNMDPVTAEENRTNININSSELQQKETNININPYESQQKEANINTDSSNIQPRQVDTNTVPVPVVQDPQQQQQPNTNKNPSELQQEATTKTNPLESQQQGANTNINPSTQTEAITNRIPSESTQIEAGNNTNSSALLDKEETRKIIPESKEKEGNFVDPTNIILQPMQIRTFLVKVKHYIKLYKGIKDD